MKNYNLQEAFKVLYEDNHIIVVDKSEGILSQADNTQDPDLLSLIKEYIKIKYQKIGNVYLGLVHRLDRRVSGIMVFAKSSKAASRLSECIRNGKMDKIYIAIVKGFIDGDGDLNNNLLKKDTVAIEDNNGLMCQLHYETFNHFNLDNHPFTVVRVKLITGRFNQIRKQFALINHPLINDFKYGYDLNNYDDSLGLRCIKLSFPHPITKEVMTFSNVREDVQGWQKFLEGQNEI